jgi:hypothetical protein
MTMVADDDNTRDWAGDCNGGRQERAVRYGGDSGVVMMAAVADDDGEGGRRWQRRTMTSADDNGMQDWAANYEGEGQEWAARGSADTEWQ